MGSGCTWPGRSRPGCAGPAVAGGRVFAGSYAAAGNRFTATELFALDAATGDVAWRVPVDLSAVATPAVDGDRVYFALGNGTVRGADLKPAGAVVCLDA